MQQIPKSTMHEFEEQQKLIEERRRKLKTGPKVVQLRYLSQHISPSELSGLEADIEKLGLELSSMDNSGIAYNSISTLAGDIVLILTEPGIVGILTSGLFTNSIYDGLKAFILKLWTLSKRKPTLTITSNTAREHETKFHLLIKIDEHRKIELKTENMDAEQLGIAIDKICHSAIDIAKEGHNVMRFETTDNRWERLNIDLDYLKRPEKLLRELPLKDYLEELRRKDNK